MSHASFTLTTEHLTLARAMYLEWCDVETGAPAVNPKRPYGNSSVARDIADLLGWGWPDEETSDDYDAEVEPLNARAMAVHHEMEVAMAVILQHAGMPTAPGVYVNGSLSRPLGVYARPAWCRTGGGLGLDALPGEQLAELAVAVDAALNGSARAKALVDGYAP
jgi:hypothetical protein